MNLLPILAATAISGRSVVDAVIWVIVAALIYYVVNWGIEKINPDPPFKKIAVAILVLVVVLLLVNALLTIGGRGFVAW